MDRPIQALLERGSLSAPVCADVRFSVADVVRMLNERKAGSALIYDGHDMVGIFTERDVLTRVVQRRKDPELTTVGEVMTIGPYTVKPETTLDEALNVMRRNEVCHLPVTQGRTAIAVLALRDIMETNAEHLEHENRVLQEFIYGAPPLAYPR